MALEAVQAQAGHRLLESTRVYLVGRSIPPCGRALIDADVATVADMLAAQEVRIARGLAGVGEWR